MVQGPFQALGPDHDGIVRGENRNGPPLPDMQFAAVGDGERGAGVRYDIGPDSPFGKMVGPFVFHQQRQVPDGVILPPAGGSQDVDHIDIGPVSGDPSDGFGLVVVFLLAFREDDIGIPFPVGEGEGIHVSHHGIRQRKTVAEVGLQGAIAAHAEIRGLNEIPGIFFPGEQSVPDDNSRCHNR